MLLLKNFNFTIGFFLLFIASASGFFLARESSYAILAQKELLDSWLYILQKSAHAHTHFFGLLHIAFGQTLTSSSCTLKQKKFQTFGLSLGSFSMSCLLLLKAYFPPVHIDYLGFLMGVLLSCSLLALATHFLGLLKKLVSLF